LGEERRNNEKEKKAREQKNLHRQRLTQEDRGMQRKLREIAREEVANERTARVGYRRIEIEEQLYIWSEEEKNC